MPAASQRSVAALIQAPTISAVATRDGVEVVDRPEERLRQPSDLFAVGIAAVGIAAVLVLAVYAHQTTLGVTEDVQKATAILNDVLGVLVNVLSGAVTLIAPIAVLVELVWRRRFRQIAEGIIAAVIGLLIAQLASFTLGQLGASQLTQSLTITVDDVPVAAIVPFIAGLAGLLTATGPRTKSRVLTWSWYLLWLSQGVDVIMGRVTLPSAIVTVLIGCLAGALVRYVSGTRPERAYGEALVEGIRRAGIDPVRVVRVMKLGDGQESARPDSSTAAIAAAADPMTLALTRYEDNRVYAAYDAAGRRWDVIVMDGDRQVIGLLASFWQAMRLRSVDRRTVVSLRQAAERAALLMYSAHAAGVRAPRLVGIGERSDSMMLVQEHPTGVRCISEFTADEIPDSALRSAWRQLRKAHTAGLAHRRITSDTVLLADGDEPDSAAWLICWDNGDVASSELARRMDDAQLLAMLALRVGAERAVASAHEVLSASDLAAIAALLQPVALPRATREESKSNPDVLDELRAALLKFIPTSEAPPPARLSRFSWRTIAMITLAVVAVWVVLTTINFQEIAKAMATANLWWFAIAFIVGLGSYVGAAFALIGFSPVRLPVWKTILVEVAASIVSLVAPGGVGPAALNLQFLKKRKVTTSLAVATVALVQVTLVVSTFLLLVVIALVTGDASAFSDVAPTVLWIALAVVVVVGITMLIPQVRSWIWAKIGPTLKQVWPRLVWVLGQPRKLLVGMGGNFLITLSCLAAFWASMMAFGVDDVPFTSIAVIYLAGNSLGSMVPTPGGLGTVEAALIGGLTTIGGQEVAVATSIAVLFRVVTYWARVPLGWFAMRYVNKREII